MSITSHYFGTTKTAKDVYKYVLSNAAGMQVEVLTYGVTIQKLIVPKANGELQDVVLGFDDLVDYEKDHPYVGCIIGRNANRLSTPVQIEGERYHLSANEGAHQLHGGRQGFHRQVWDAHIEEETLVMKYLSKDGEEGFPGNLLVETRFNLNEKSLEIECYATTDKTTIVNLTRHEYFNLDYGHSRDITHHMVQINADLYTPLKEDSLATGEIASVENTLYDFRKPVLVNKIRDGIDNNLIVGKADASLKTHAKIYNEASDLKFTLLATQPCLQFYTAHKYIDYSGKGGHSLGLNPGLCLEPQSYPNAHKHSQFPSTFLKPEETYYQKMIYRFE